jgi:Domain of unknown function (DUF1707)/Cell wall-active antibiotics response 4TMS YvqF
VDEMNVRSSDAEREATVARLRDAAAEGRLTLEELAERVEAADAARTRSELARLVADLRAAMEPVGDSSPAPRANQRLYGILGGDTLSGRVRLGPQCRVINIMGGADLDLTQAVLVEGEVTIRVFSLWGGSNIIVPHGVHVDYRGRGLLGWDEVESPEGDPPPPGAPVVRIRSLSIMGGTDVKRGAPRPWRWPWQRRRQALPPS